MPSLRSSGGPWRIKSMRSELWSPNGTVASRGLKAGLTDDTDSALFGVTIEARPVDDFGSFLGLADCDADVEREVEFETVFGRGVATERGDGILGVVLASSSGPVDRMKSAKSRVDSFSIRAFRATG